MKSQFPDPEILRKLNSDCDRLSNTEWTLPTSRASVKKGQDWKLQSKLGPEHLTDDIFTADSQQTPDFAIDWYQAHHDKEN